MLFVSKEVGHLAINVPLYSIHYADKISTYVCAQYFNIDIYELYCSAVHFCWFKQSDRIFSGTLCRPIQLFTTFNHILMLMVKVPKDHFQVNSLQIVCTFCANVDYRVILQLPNCVYRQQYHSMASYDMVGRL